MEELIMSKYVSGFAGLWEDEYKFVEASKKCYDMGYTNLDAITPYPVHGMEEALHIKRSNIPYVTFIAGLIGCSAGLWLTWWTSAVNWPVNVGGKPPFSLPAFIPVIFELTVLFAALSSVAALFVFCNLPKVNPPLIDEDVTSHKFAIFIPKDGGSYDEAKLAQLFKDLGATEVKKIAEY
jgi:hypothetical protein